MGLNFAKISIDIARTLCPDGVVDYEQSGLVYFIQHRSPINIPNNEVYPGNRGGDRIGFL